MHRLPAPFLLLLLLIFLTRQHAGAQSNYYIEEQHTFSGALIAGMNFTQIDGDDYEGYHKHGLNLGGAVYTRVGENVKASMELLYAQKGSSGALLDRSTVGVFILSYKVQLNYAEVPLQLYYVDKRKHQFGGGFSNSRLVSSDEVAEGSVSVSNGQYPFHKSDINFLLSSNVHLWKGFYACVRFQYSLVSIRKQIPPGLGRESQFNNVWAFRLMYLF